MATVSVSRSDLFPPTTTVGIYPPGSKPRYYDGPPTAAEIAHADVDAAGALSVTDAGLVAGKTYVAYAAVGGQHRAVRVRSTTDKFDSGRATGTGDTNSTTALANVSATTGAFAVGQRITGPGIPAGTYLLSGSGANWVMSAAATATASTVALEGHGTYRWRAKVMQRRAAIGTS